MGERLAVEKARSQRIFKREDDMSKRYEWKDLLDAYIKAQRRHYVHEDFTKYYKGHLAALEEAFGVSVSVERVRNPGVRALWVPFQGALASFLSIRTPWDNVLEDSLTNRVIDERLGEQGKQIRRLEADVSQAIQLSKVVHLELLEELFNVLWGPITQVVTSEDLLKLGFDDSKEPQYLDYVDHLWGIE